MAESQDCLQMGQEVSVVLPACLCVGFICRVAWEPRVHWQHLSRASFNVGSSNKSKGSVPRAEATFWVSLCGQFFHPCVLEIGQLRPWGPQPQRGEEDKTVLWRKHGVLNKVKRIARFKNLTSPEKQQNPPIFHS